MTGSRVSESCPEGPLDIFSVPNIDNNEKTSDSANLKSLVNHKQLDVDSAYEHILLLSKQNSPAVEFCYSVRAHLTSIAV